MPLPFIIAGLGALSSAVSAAGATAAATAAAASAAAAGAATTAAGVITANAVPLAGAGVVCAAIGYSAGEDDGYQKGKKEGYNVASSEYEQKLRNQAEKFKKEKESLLAQARASAAAKDRLIQDCIDAIQELERENERLKGQNQRLPSEKQEWLNIYRSMKRELVAA